MDIYKKIFNSRVIILLIISIILLIIIYKLYYQNNDKYRNIEHFGILKHLKSKKKSKNNFKNIPKNNNKSDISFEELVKSSEKFSKEKDKLSNVTDSISNYRNSFKHPKFKNNSANTAEALEKFGFYKEKFLEIFK